MLGVAAALPESILINTAIDAPAGPNGPAHTPPSPAIQMAGGLSEFSLPCQGGIPDAPTQGRFAPGRLPADRSHWTNALQSENMANIRAEDGTPRRCISRSARTPSSLVQRDSSPATMPYGDFDIESLAVYLHLTPQQVARLADRGRLPGRKVSGRWRFARAEIHHWLEKRIGLSDEGELVDVEDVLQRSGGEGRPREIRIGQLLPLQAIAVPLAARTRNSVITRMVELAANTGWIWDPPKMVEAVRAREDMLPTALENGVALLHPRRPMSRILSQPFVALGRTGTGIPFGGAAPTTDVFFLVCSTDDRGHLRVLARLSRVLASPGFLDALRQTPDAGAAHRLIVGTEAKL